jgi:hypothetical protein
MHLQADLGRDHRPLERVKLLSATGSVLLATAQLGRSQPPSGMLRAGCW